MRRIAPFEGQCLRREREEIYSLYFQGYNNREIHDNHADMSLDDGILRLNAKFKNLMQLMEQYGNVRCSEF